MEYCWSVSYWFFSQIISQGEVIIRSDRMTLSILLIAAFIRGCSLLNAAPSDQAVLDSLRDAGSDMTKSHPFDFYLYHPDETGAAQICTQLRGEGFQVTVREGAVDGDWLCLASLSFVPSIEKLSELRVKFDHLIDQYGGQYDGWETIVIP
jgi:hypothetical protein